jgi:AmmeMemoRadiSam system protein B
LQTTIRDLLDEAEPEGPSPKAVIVPHAGLQDAGPASACAFAQLSIDRQVIRRVILIGPAHFVRVAGLALSSAEAFATPLGLLPVDCDTVERLAQLPCAQTQDLAHAFEHSLEVQLPFLQEALEPVIIVPIAVGDIAPEALGLVLSALWGGPETRIIVSSDLSHALDADTASTIDEAAAHTIETLEQHGLQAEGACGREAINGLLWLARVRRMRVTRIALGHAADLADADARGIGYGAFTFLEPD